MIQSGLKIQLCNIIAFDVRAISVFFSDFKISSVFLRLSYLRLKNKQTNTKNKQTSEQKIQSKTKLKQAKTQTICKRRRLRVSSPIEATFLIISK